MIPPFKNTMHDEWVEPVDKRALVAKHILNVVSKIVSSGMLPTTENALVEVMAQLLEAAMWSMPVDIKLMVARYIVNNDILILNYMINYFI